MHNTRNQNGGFSRLCLLAASLFLLAPALFAGNGDGNCLYLITSAGYAKIVDNDGIADRFDFGSSGSGSGGFVVEFWAKTPAASGTACTFFYHYDPDAVPDPLGWIIGLDASGQLNLTIGGSTGAGTAVWNHDLCNGKWNHIIVQREAGVAGTLNFYLNGLDMGAADTNPALSGDASAGLDVDCYIGRIAAGGSSFAGMLDEIRIWGNAYPIESVLQQSLYWDWDRVLDAGYSLDDAPDPVAYYRCNTNSGKYLYDESPAGYGLLGTIAGTANSHYAWRLSGAFAGPKNALAFDGTNDYIQTPDDSGLDFGTGNFTLEFWIKAASQTATLLHHWDTVGDDQGCIVSVSSGAVVLQIADRTTEFSRVIADGTWHHVAMVRNGDTVACYVDGAPSGVEAGSSATGYAAKSATSSSDLYVGVDSALANDFTGQLDEVRIWSIDRPAAELRDNMMRNLVGDEAYLVIDYRMDVGLADGDNTGYTTLYNHSASAPALDGGLNGFALTGSASNFVASTAFNTWIATDDTLNVTGDAAWTTALNWSLNAAPGAASNVGVYKWGSANKKVPTISANAAVNHLMVDSNSASLKFTSGTLTLHGNLIRNTGSFIQSAGTTLAFSGGDTTYPYAQYCIGALNTAHLDVNNNKGVSFNEAVVASGNVGLGTNGTTIADFAGSLTVGGNLSIAEGGATTATFAAVTAANAVSIGTTDVANTANVTFNGTFLANGVDGIDDVVIGLQTGEDAGGPANQVAFNGTSGASTISQELQVLSGTVTLGGDLTVLDDLTISNGYQDTWLNLNGRNLYLGDADHDAQLSEVIDADHNHTVYGYAGNIIAERYMTSNSGVNVANLGLTLTYSGDPGVTFIARRHQGEAGIWGRRGIKRAYEVTPTTPLSATGISFAYGWETDSPGAPTYELNSLVENDLRLFVSNPSDTTSGGWSDFFGSQQSGHVVSYTGTAKVFSDSGTVVTLAGMMSPLLVHLNYFRAEPDVVQGGVSLVWETSSEVDNAGFYVWRAEGPDGPWGCLNPTAIIPGEGNETTGALYYLLDTGVEPNVTYYYKLEDVDIHGASMFHPIVSATMPYIPVTPITSQPPASGHGGGALR